MERFKELAHKARISNAAIQKDKKYTRAQSAPAAPVAPAAQSAPSVERFLHTTSSIEKRLDDIECSIKKIELNLILVDGEGENYAEYSDLKNKLKGICRVSCKLFNITIFLSVSYHLVTNSPSVSIVNGPY